MQNWVFLSSLDNLLQKNVIVFFYVNQILKWRSFDKRAILPTFHIFSYQGKVTKIPSAHISLTRASKSTGERERRSQKKNYG